MKKSKVLLLMLCTVALSVGVTFGTLAYLTDTEAVTNTFTVGQVHISLDEADVKPDGTYETDKTARVIENEYHLIPGHTYIKDPTIYVGNDSEECYLFVKVENGIKNIETTDAAKTVAGQMAAKGWVEIDANKHIYVLDKNGDKTYTVFKGAEVVVFDNFTIAGDGVNNDDIAKYDTEKNQTVIEVTAYAIQAAGFDNANLAWEAYAAQHPNP